MCEHLSDLEFEEATACVAAFHVSFLHVLLVILAITKDGKEVNKSKKRQKP